MTGSKGTLRIRPRRLLLFGAVLAVGVFIVAGLGSGLENQSDPRNDSFGVIYQGNPTQDCWKHHKPEGMKDSHYVVPLLPKALDMGTPRNLDLQVANAWKHYISEMTIQLNLSASSTGEPLLVPLVGSAAQSVPPLREGATGQLGNPTHFGTAGGGLDTVGDQTGVDAERPGPPTNFSFFFDVKPNAQSFFAKLELFYPEGPPVQSVPNAVRADVFVGGKGVGYDMRDAETHERDQDGESTERYLALPLESGIDTIVPEPGRWRIELEFLRGDSPIVGFALNVTAVYAGAGAATFDVFHIAREPPGEVEDPEIIVDVGGVTDIISIPVLGIAPGVQTVDVMVEAQIYYKHQSGGTPNQDWFRRYYTIDIPVGQEFQASDAEASTGGVVETDFYLVAGEITGFTAAFLLVPSVLFGGTYGRGSRKLFNSMLGGAKRRVMFHSLMSLGLSLTAIVHIVLFLLEVRYTVLMGVLWGGLGAFSLLILGLTGYYQVPFIQRFGYNWWRWTHLAFGLLVMVFVAYHAVADGPDFFFLKEQLPQWVNDMNLAQK